MGYTTDFTGMISIDPPLSCEEADFLRKFSDSRRMDRDEGPYYVDAGGLKGQDRVDGIHDYNNPPSGQPGLWCNWAPSGCGKFIEWNGAEKFYYASEWMEYLINHFLKPDSVAKSGLPFLKDHILNGQIEAQGEEASDKWTLMVKDNGVSVKNFVFTSEKIICPHCDEEFYAEQAGNQ